MKRTGTLNKWPLAKLFTKADPLLAVVVGSVIGIIFAFGYYEYTTRASVTLVLFVVLVMQFVLLLVLGPGQGVATIPIALFALGSSMAITLTLLQFHGLWSGIETGMVLIIVITFPVMVAIMAAVLHLAGQVTKRG